MPADELWEDVDRLLDRLTPELAAEHGLGPLAARRLRRAGDEVPERLLREERAGRTASLIAPALLRRVREAYDGPLLLLKGPELTAKYPDAARRFGDLDLVAGDAEEAQAALLAAGFRLEERPRWPPRGYDDVHRPHYHLHPLEWPGLALRIEVHKHVKWPEDLRPPRNEELFEAAEPSTVGVEGLLAPHPHHHAVLLVSHAWGEIPMQNLRQLVDVLAFVDDDERGEVGGLAANWGIERGWRSTLAVADWLILGEPEPRLVGVWARYLRDLREPNCARDARPGVALPVLAHDTPGCRPESVPRGSPRLESRAGPDLGRQAAADGPGSHASTVLDVRALPTVGVPPLRHRAMDARPVADADLWRQGVRPVSRDRPADEGT